MPATAALWLAIYFLINIRRKVRAAAALHSPRVATAAVARPRVVLKLKQTHQGVYYGSHYFVFVYFLIIINQKVCA